MAGIACPSCGGKMFFDIPKQQLKCPYCGTLKDPSEYAEENKAEAHKDTYGTQVFTCRNCGAELTAPDEQAVAYCSYCGSEGMLDAKYEEVIRPRTMIPFQKSKKQAGNEYEKALQGKFYVPNEFKQSEFIEGFRGIYLPYYSYEAVVPEKTISFKGYRDYTRSKYDYHEEYDMTAQIGGVARGVQYDASIAFDDTIANEIAPFKPENERGFNEAYLAGFYADKATTPVNTYIEDATEQAVDSVYSDIKKMSGGVIPVNKDSIEEKKAAIGVESFHCNVILYPIWFLTWRHKNRVAYSVMNGQTGKISMDIPVDKKKFFLVSGIAAAVIFVILSLLPIFILPGTLALLAGILTCVSGVVLEREIQRIYFRENHIYDYGDVMHTAKKKKMKAGKKDSEQKKKVAKAAATGIGCGLLAFGTVGIYAITAVVVAISAVFSGVSANGARIFFFCAATVIQIICTILTVRYSSQTERKTAIFASIFSALVLVFGVAVSIMNPAHDYWYYGVALACLLALVLNGLSAINYFNYLLTRPVPNFYEREGADHGK